MGQNFKIIILIFALGVTGCSSHHEGVKSYEEVFVANNADKFEFFHFRFFGSDNVLIVSENQNPENDYSNLCDSYQMKCSRFHLNVSSESASNQIDSILSKIKSYNGVSFLLISDSKDTTAAIISKYAQDRYRDQNVKQIFKTFEPEKPEEVLNLLNQKTL